MVASICVLLDLPESVKGSKRSEVKFAHAGCKEQESPVFSALGASVRV